MAILRGTGRIFPVDTLIEEMQKVAGAVVRIIGPDSDGQELGRSTGWFVAPQLVVVPGFAFNLSDADVARAVRVAGAKGREWSAVSSEPPELLGEGLLGQGGKGPALAVLHFAAPAPERVLPLSFDLQTPGDPVWLFHFPGGEPAVQASFGQIRSADENAVTYDADTLPGSSGAPVLDSFWRVLGMHIGERRENRVNWGLPRSLLLKALQGSRFWSEIAAHQNLADVVAAQAALEATTPEPQPTTPAPILIRAAISPNVNPKSLSKAERELLRAAVVDGQAARWTLRPAERRRVLAAMGSLDSLKPFRRRARTKGSDPLQRVLDRILDGPPHVLADASEDELGWWIQAARWFAPIAGELPKPADIARELERRRVRSRLDRIAGPEFQGRKKDLDALRDWYRAGKGPMVLTGIGGIGKSALVARFATQLPDHTLLLWLDFDRADLAPDDAVSVLGALFDQAAVQLDGLDKPKFDETNWQDHAQALGERLAQSVGTNPSLLVLDSFEAAQYVERYQELWPVLEHLARGLPDLRICATGRAPVPGLQLSGKNAEARHLTGLDDADVRAWLQARGIKQKAIVDRVVKIARGIPLVLRLAFRLLETGGKIADLPRELPEHLIAGYLYDRILDRVQNPEFKPLASGLLVLRRVSLEMVKPVLDQLVPFPPGDPASWFAELAREPALVGGANVLVPRPEVRSATLWLLEHDQPDLVRDVDRRAAEWYAAQGADTPEEAAELVYHRLRLGETAGAEQAWRDGCGAFLTYAADDIRDAVARTWLQHRLGGIGEAPQPLSVWEQDAAERIRSARGRRLDRATAEILRERAERSEASPLIFHEAYELRASGQSAQASELLDKSSAVAGPIGRDRGLLRALLAMEAGDRRTADALLGAIDQPAQWSDRPTAAVDALAVLAARIQLTVDPDQEFALLKSDPARWEHARRVLAPVDVVSPRLKERLRRSTPTLESTGQYIPIDNLDGTRLLAAIEHERRLSLPDEPGAVREERQRILDDWTQTGNWSLPVLPYEDVAPNVPSLMELGWRRWWLAARRAFLEPAYQLCIYKNSTPSSLVPAIISMLALFAGRFGSFALGNPDMPFVDALGKSSLGRGALYVRKEDWPRLKGMLQTTVDTHDWDSHINSEQDQHVVFWGADLVQYRTPELIAESAEPGPFLLYLFGPDPLSTLVNDVAGVVPPLTS